MGQTLTHGVYLPDEGERNCYNGLAANWQLLDNSLGTVAEHTTQIAGKAPAVHTHTVSQITDFPAYGNAAGTICEGNDSRLSDARTPVAHTHTKSDVTDLLNSNFIPSANNSYDLGSASKQWLNTYSKGYYYNGVAWGLDKENVWSANNEYKYLIGLSGAEIWFKHQNIEDITANPDANIDKSIIKIYNKAVAQYFGEISDGLRTDGSHRLTISCFGFPLNNYAGYYPHTFYFEAKRDGTASFSPSYTNASLGTSTNKWKTLNGINPGALSLPTTDTSKYADISGSLTINIPNTYTPAVDGWISIELKRTNAPMAVFLAQGYVKAAGYSNAPHVDNGDFFASACLPVRAGIAVDIYIRGATATIESAYFIPCEGNV